MTPTDVPPALPLPWALDSYLAVSSASLLGGLIGISNFTCGKLNCWSISPNPLLHSALLRLSDLTIHTDVQAQTLSLMLKFFVSLPSHNESIIKLFGFIFKIHPECDPFPHRHVPRHHHLLSRLLPTIILTWLLFLLIPAGSSLCTVTSVIAANVNQIKLEPDNGFPYTSNEM